MSRKLLKNNSFDLCLNLFTLATTQRVFVFGYGSHLVGYIFKYSYILVIETICENLVKITGIIVEIWAHLLLWRRLKIAKLRYAYYYSFCVGVDIVLNYHSAKFGNNWKKHGWNIEVNLILFQNWYPSFLFRQGWLYTRK